MIFFVDRLLNIGIKVEIINFVSDFKEIMVDMVDVNSMDEDNWVDVGDGEIEESKVL